MAHTNETTNYSLPQFVGTDKPSWLNDFNGAMSAIDAQMKSNDDAAAAADTKAEAAAGGVSGLTTRMTTAEGKITTLEGKMTTAEGDIDDLEAAVEKAEYFTGEGLTTFLTYWGAAGFLSGNKKSATFYLDLPKMKKPGAVPPVNMVTCNIMIAASDGHIDGNSYKDYMHEPGVTVSCSFATNTQIAVTIAKDEAFNATYGNCPIYAHGTIEVESV